MRYGPFQVGRKPDHGIRYYCLHVPGLMAPDCLGATNEDNVTNATSCKPRGAGAMSLLCRRAAAQDSRREYYHCSLVGASVPPPAQKLPKRARGLVNPAAADWTHSGPLHVRPAQVPQPSVGAKRVWHRVGSLTSLVPEESAVQRIPRRSRPPRGVAHRMSRSCQAARQALTVRLHSTPGPVTLRA